MIEFISAKSKRAANDLLTFMKKGGGSHGKGDGKGGGKRGKSLSECDGTPKIKKYGECGSHGAQKCRKFCSKKFGDSLSKAVCSGGESGGEAEEKDSDSEVEMKSGGKGGKSGHKGGKSKGKGGKSGGKGGKSKGRKRRSGEKGKKGKSSKGKCHCWICDSGSKSSGSGEDFFCSNLSPT